MPTLSAPRTELRGDPTRPAALLMSEVTRAYDRGRPVLDRVSLEVPGGSFLAITGPAGSGKSTLLHCAAGLEQPESGEVRVGGALVSGPGRPGRAVLRQGRVGFVFRDYNLLPSLTVEENLTLPLLLSGSRTDPRWLRTLIERAGLTRLLGRRPSELSGGERQRAAVARSMAARPEVVFADEPTGALADAEAVEVLDLLRELVDEFGQTVVIATRDAAAADRAHATAALAGGRIDRYWRGPAVAAAA